MHFLYLLPLVAQVYHALAATPEQWRSRSIYQVVTDRFARTDGSTSAPCDAGLGKYCGGTWNGLMDKLDYIQGMGFDAVWISPITFQEEEATADLLSYHGYWQQDLYRVNPSFGTESDLQALSAALHSRGMYLMVDIVVNHFAWPGDGTTVDYSKLNPFNSEKYFHPYELLSDASPDNFTAAQVNWLGDTVLSLPDVRTEDTEVANMYYSWIESLVSKYSIDGLRIDTVLNVNPEFFPGFNKAAGVFCTGEVFDGDASSACWLQEDLDSFINFPIYFYLIRAFNTTNGDIPALANQMASVKSNCRDVQVLTTFSENHDFPRFPAMNPDMSLAQNLITFNILADGIPIIYYGQEQHFSGAFNPVNREALWLSRYNTDAPLYKLISSLNAIRTHAFQKSSNYATSVGNPIYNDKHTIALRKGLDGSQIITVVTNFGETSDTQIFNINGTGLANGEKVMEILTCTEQTALSDGSLDVKIVNGLPNVFYPSAALEGSNICEDGETSSSGSGSGSGSITSKQNEAGNSTTTTDPSTVADPSPAGDPHAGGDPPSVAASPTGGDPPSVTASPSGGDPPSGAASPTGGDPPIGSDSPAGGNSPAGDSHYSGDSDHSGDSQASLPKVWKAAVWREAVPLAA